MGGDGKTALTYPHNTRDGFVLPGGNLLLAVTKGAPEFPHGGAVELTPSGKTIWQYKGTQDEVNTVERLGEGRYLVAEAGDKPRLLEIDADGKVVVEVPIQAQTHDHHLQTRMSRKLPEWKLPRPAIARQSGARICAGRQNRLGSQNPGKSE